MERRVTTLMGDKVEPRRNGLRRMSPFGLDEESNILENENLSLAEEV
ncbi:hypothetical protein ACEQPO_14985 [Bacillus sp. SL00103]